MPSKPRWRGSRSRRKLGIDGRRKARGAGEERAAPTVLIWSFCTARDAFFESLARWTVDAKIASAASPRWTARSCCRGHLARRRRTRTPPVTTVALLVAVAIWNTEDDDMFYPVSNSVEWRDAAAPGNEGIGSYKIYKSTRDDGQHRGGRRRDRRRDGSEAGWRAHAVREPASPDRICPLSRYPHYLFETTHIAYPGATHRLPG